MTHRKRADAPDVRHPARGEPVGLYRWRPYGKPQEDEKRGWGWMACRFHALPGMPRASVLVELKEVGRRRRRRMIDEQIPVPRGLVEDAIALIIAGSLIAIDVDRFPEMQGCQKVVELLGQTLAAAREEEAGDV